jgi:hypothetical protein
VIIPKNKLDGMFKELSFDPHLIRTMINEGMHDANLAIKNFPQKPNDIKE